MYVYKYVYVHMCVHINVYESVAVWQLLSVHAPPAPILAGMYL